MKITSVIATFGFTKNIGNYQTLRADATVSVNLEDGETAEQAFEKAFEIVKNQIATKTGGTKL